MAANNLPSKMKQILVNTLSTDFRKATSIVEVPVPNPASDEVLVKNSYVGINASDINYAAGRYSSELKLPFGVGFEGIGKVVRAGADSKLKEGQTVVFSKAGAFSEYVVVKANVAIPVPSVDPALMAIVVSGLTASVALEKDADLKEGKKVLVTAAAGGTGQYAVQIAKLAGCHVIGTCSSAEKVEFLKSIGCDRPINYKEEDLNTVLSKEYPSGIDVVYESIGKDIFDAALKNLAPFGRLLVIGMISGYKSDGSITSGATVNIPMLCLSKCASVRGFFLPRYLEDLPRHTAMLIKMYMESKIKVKVDNGTPEKPFKGLSGVADAIDYMFSGKNIGKLVVDIGGENSEQ